MNASSEGTPGRNVLLALGVVISYLIAEILTLGVLFQPTLPLSIFLTRFLGLQIGVVLSVLASGMVSAVGAEALYISFIKGNLKPSTPQPQLPKAPEGLEQSTLNQMLDDSSRNFVEVFPLKTGALNVYGAISKEEGVEGYRYLVIEPELNEREKKQFTELKELLIEEMDVDLRSIESREKAEGFLSSKVATLARNYGYNIPRPSMRKLQYYFTRDFIHLGKIEPLMLDPLIEDISCDGANIPIYIWHRDYESIPTNVAFTTDKELDTFVSKLAYVSGKHISLASPLVDASLLDGSRLHLTYGKEVTQRGSTFTIRKFRADPLTIVDLIKYGTINAEVAAYLWYLIEKRMSMLISGPTASGKTTLLNTLSMFIIPGQKVISIEDSVTGDSEILISEEGRIRKVKIGPYIDSALSRGSVNSMFGHEMARPHNIRVLTADRAGRVSWGTCTALIRHRVKKGFVNVATRAGRVIEVTADHSLFTLGENGDVVELSGGEISTETYLVTPRLIPSDGRDFTFDLGRPSEFSDYWFKPAPNADAQGNATQQLRVHATHSPLSIPAVIRLDDDIAFLCGLWIADGLYDERSVGFSVGGKGIESRIRSIANSLGVNMTRHSDGVSILINSKPLKTLFGETLGVRGDDPARRVPDIFFSATDAVVASFLRGYFTGDGNVSKSEIYAESASRQLLVDIQTLLLRFGITMRVGLTRKVGTLGRIGTYRAVVTGRNQITRFKEVVGFEQPGQMLKIHDGKKRSAYSLDPVPLPGPLADEVRGGKTIGMNSKVRQSVNAAVKRGVIARQTLLDLGAENPEFKKTRAYSLATSEFCFDRVVSVERSVREENVYDLSVPETGTFIANNIVCHNTPEIQLPHENWIQEVTRAVGTAQEITLFDLVRNSLRQRPDIIIVGEIRGNEAFTLFQAISTGHGGLSTVHADSVESVFNRLTTDPMNIPRSLVGTTLDCIVLQLKLRIGDRSVRRVVSVNEILGYDNRTNEMIMNEVYKWDPLTDRINATGRGRLIDKIYQRYGTKPEEIRRDLDSRRVFLEWLASKSYRSYKEVSALVQEFYSNPYAMASRARTELEVAR